MEQIFSSIFNNPELSDLKFIVGTERVEFYGHKLILVLQSKYFEKQFSSEENEIISSRTITEFKIPHFHPWIFAIILRYLYINKLDDVYYLTEDNVLEVLRGAKEFQIIGLENLCSNFLSRNLSPENWLKYYEFSINEEFFSLKEKIDMKFARAKAFFMKQNCLNSIQSKTLSFLLSNNNFEFPEIVLFQRLLDWGRYQNSINQIQESTENLRKILLTFLPLIRFEIMNLEDLAFVAKTNLLDDHEIVKFFAQISPDRKFLKNSSRVIPKFVLEEQKVLLLSSCSSVEWTEDVRKSIGSGGIKQIDIISISEKTPKLEEMLEYDGIFILTVNSALDKELLGNLLAEYIEPSNKNNFQGRGIVVASIYILDKDNYACLEGRIIKEKFLPLETGKDNWDKGYLLDTNFDIPDHPILENVKSFDGGKYSEHIKHDLITPNSKVIARWTDRTPFILEKKLDDSFGMAVVLNLFPVSDNAYSDGWLSSTDGAKIIANSVRYVLEQNHL